MYIDLALCVYEFDALVALRMSDSAVTAFLVVAHVVEASCRRRRAGWCHACGWLFRLVGTIEVVIIHTQTSAVAMSLGIVNSKFTRLCS